MATIAENMQVVLIGYIEGAPRESDMEVKLAKVELKAPERSGAFLVKNLGEIFAPAHDQYCTEDFIKNLCLCCDPYMRGRMRNFHGYYIPPFVPGQPIEGFGMAKVLDSDNPDFKPGNYISGITGWEEYSLIRNTSQLRKIQPDDCIPLSYHVGLLGMPGFTAYVGFYKICSRKKGEYGFVSAASAAVGQLVGQLAKLHGCYIVGSAGSSQKIDLLKNQLGFDDAFNYKEEADLDAALKRYFPEGIDIYFDIVGGAMLDAVLLNMSVHGRIAVCRMVSLHSFSDPNGIHNLYRLVPKRVKMQGFLQSDYLHKIPEFLEHVSESYKQKKIVYIEDTNEGLETAPAPLVGLFSGKNVGKQVICVARE